LQQSKNTMEQTNTRQSSGCCIVIRLCDLANA
jgi:hypothetical protein